MWSEEAQSVQAGQVVRPERRPGESGSPLLILYHRREPGCRREGFLQAEASLTFLCLTLNDADRGAAA